MKCFTLKPHKDVILEPTFNHPMVYAGPELYPQPQPGILAPRTDCAIEFAPGTRASLSPALRSSCRPAPQHPTDLLIERASLERTPDGTILLVPETTPETDRALVLLDVGRGTYNSVRYEVGNGVILRARRHCPNSVQGTEELALVEVPVGRPFTIYRSSRRWLCFGSEVVGEQLLLRFDGEQLKCEPVK